MSNPYIGEIRIFAGNFAPRGWAFCDGQVLPIAQNTALFSIIGTTYGGDGRTTTGLPNLQGQAPMHPGRGPGLTSRRLGQRVGAETVTLTEAQIPNHGHTLRASTTAAPFGASETLTNNSSFGKVTGGSAYRSDTTANLVNLASAAVSTTGGGQAHANMQPYLTLNFIIATVGLYPSRS